MVDPNGAEGVEGLGAAAGPEAHRGVRGMTGKEEVGRMWEPSEARGMTGHCGADEFWAWRAKMEPEGWGFAATTLKSTLDLGDQEGWGEPGDQEDEAEPGSWTEPAKENNWVEPAKEEEQRNWAEPWNWWS